MLSIEQVEKVLQSLPPKEERPASSFTQEELQARIDDALTLVMEWLVLLANPSTDSLGLLERYPLSVVKRNDDDDAAIQHLKENNLNHLAYGTLNKLLFWIREKNGLNMQLRQQISMGKPEFNYSIIRQFFELNAFIKQTIFSNPIVMNHPQTFEFFRLLSCTACGIESFEEFELILSQIPGDKNIAMIDSMGVPYFAFHLSLYGAPPNPNRSRLINEIIGNTATRSGKTPLEITIHLSKKFTLSYDIMRAQFDIIKASISTDQNLSLVETLSSVGDAFSETYLLWTRMDARQRINTTDPCFALQNINHLLLSQTQSDRSVFINKCHSIARRMIGHADPKWQELGMVILALGALVAALGLASIIPGGAIPVALGIGASIVGFGIFAHNRQKGPSKATQRLIDEMKNMSENPVCFA